MSIIIIINAIFLGFNNPLFSPSSIYSQIYNYS